MTTIINTTHLRDSFADVAKQVRGSKTVAIVTKRGRPDLALIDLDYLEDLLEAQDKDFQKSLREAAKEKVYTLDEVFTDISE